MNLNSTRDWKTLLSFLRSDFERLAVEHKLLNTQYPNVKIGSASELLRLFFVHAGTDLPLRQTVAVVGEAGGPQVSAVRLHLKMRAAGPYLATLIAGLCGDAQELSPEKWGGYELVVVDASTVSGPGADNADARLHTVLRVADLRPIDVKVTDAREGETLRRFLWMPGQLVIGDRGYSNGPGIAKVVDDGADVLIRVNRGALPLHDDDGPVDLLGWLRSLQGHRAAERPVQIRLWDAQRHLRVVAGRLIGFRLPDEDAADARERVLREQGTSATDETLEAAGYVVLFTTAPATKLSAARGVEAYRLRWQVELQFKRWKSLCRFDRLPNYRDDTILSWLSIKVLLGLLLDKMGSAAAELFPPEQYRYVDRRTVAYRTPALEAHKHPLASHGVSNSPVRAA